MIKAFLHNYINTSAEIKRSAKNIEFSFLCEEVLRISHFYHFLSLSLPYAIRYQFQQLENNDIFSTPMHLQKPANTW